MSWQIPCWQCGSHSLKIGNKPVGTSPRATAYVFYFLNRSSVGVKTLFWLPLNPEKSAWHIASTQILIGQVIKLAGSA